jgi:hypothetical protein
MRFSYNTIARSWRAGVLYMPVKTHPNALSLSLSVSVRSHSEEASPKSSDTHYSSKQFIIPCARARSTTRYGYGLPRVTPVLWHSFSREKNRVAKSSCNENTGLRLLISKGNTVLTLSPELRVNAELCSCGDVIGVGETLCDEV